MTLQRSTTLGALRDVINPDKLLLRPPTTLMGPEAPFQLCLGPSAPSQAMLEESQSPAQPQTWPCLVKEPHHLDPSPWSSKICCALTVISGLLEPWIEGHRVMVSGLWLQTLLTHQPFPGLWPPQSADPSLNPRLWSQSPFCTQVSGACQRWPQVSCAIALSSIVVLAFCPFRSLKQSPDTSILLPAQDSVSALQDHPLPVTTGPAGLYILTAMPCPVTAPQICYQPCGVLKAKRYRTHAQSQEEQNMLINVIMYSYL